VKVFYGLLREPDLQNVQVDPEEDEGSAATETSAARDSNTSTPGGSGTQKSEPAATPASQASSQGSAVAATPSSDQKSTPSKKKKGKKDWLGLSKKGKNDPNAPPMTRMPLPELRDVDKLEKAKALRESAKRATLGADKLPSICMYSLLNVDNL